MLETAVKNIGNGIFATLEELIEQKKYIKYINYNRKKTNSKYVGDVKSIFKGRGVEFEEIRSYEFGDEVRDIDWKVTARKDEPYSKIYNEERNKDNYVFLDMSSSMIFGTKKELKSVMASKLTALFAWASLENKDKFGCFIYTGEKTFFFKAQNSNSSILAVLKKISDISKQITESEIVDKISLNSALLMFDKHLKHSSNVFVISDFEGFDEDIKKHLFISSKKSKLCLINICDEIETSPPKKGDYMIVNAEQEFVFESENQDTFDDYIQYFVYKNQKIEEFCRKSFSRYISVILGIDGFRQINLS